MPNPNEYDPVVAQAVWDDRPPPYGRVGMKYTDDDMKTIYLQMSGQCEDGSWESSNDTTWCVDEINDDDVKYIRSDVVAALEAELAEAKASTWERAEHEAREDITAMDEEQQKALRERDATIATIGAKLADAYVLSERLKLEAEAHAQEARTANASLAECYQVASGGKGEPGNWHGAQPIREAIAERDATIAAQAAQIAKLREIVERFDYTNPELMVRQLRTALDALAQPATEAHGE